MPRPRPSERELAKLVELVRKEGSAAAASRALKGKLSPSTIKDRLRLAGVSASELAPDKPQAPAEAPIDARTKLRMADRIRELESELKAVHRAELKTEDVRRELFGMDVNSLKPQKWVAEVPASSGSSPGTPIMMVSDVHWNEVVRKVEVNGLNEYNPKIQQARLKLAAERAIDLCWNHIQNPSYPGIVVLLGGDMVSGDIHEELELNNAAESIPTVLDLAEHLVSFLTTLADKFGRVFVATCYGNHGRQHKQYRYKRHAYQSYDWLTYQMVARYFKVSGDDRVTFFIPDGPDALFVVAGRSYLLTHGDNLGVNGGDGIIGALGPIRRGAVKVRGQYASMGMGYDTLVMGHWHQLIMLDDIIVNGCGIGYSEYSKNHRFPIEPPRYALWGTHPKRGISYRYSVNMEDYVAKPTPGGGWVSWNPTLS